MSELTPSPPAPDSLGRFDVESEVGHGAAGVVFRAVDRELGQLVALKVFVLPPGATSEPERLLHEGELLARIHHPAVVQIVDYGMIGQAGARLCGRRFEAGTPYLAMEWLEGHDLQRRQAQQPLSLPDALDVGRQVAGALAVVHRERIAHRDIKPSNVFVLEGSSPPLVKVVDFGVATGADPVGDALGAFVGTLAYMAPEQARGDASVDVRCDIYSLGSMLFELLTGRTPHTGPSNVAILAKLVSTPAPRLGELLADVPAELDDLVADLLHQDWRLRPDAEQAAERLRAVLANPGLPRAAVAIDRQLESVHSSASRLLTTLVALRVGSTERREQEIEQLLEQGADAVRLGNDSLVAFFGARRAHGGEAARAVDCGARLSALGAQVGVATGRALVELTRPVGLVVDLASSLARDAAAGAVQADEITAELARERFTFTSVGPGTTVLQACAPERRTTRELSPFVGRSSELEALLAGFRRCASVPTPVVASAIGPPGIGKSRLGRELVRAVADRRGRNGASGGTERVGAPAIRPGSSASPMATSAATAPPAEHGSAAAPVERGTLEPERGVDTLRPGEPVRQASHVRVVLVRSEAYGRARALGVAADALSDLLGLPRGSPRGSAAQALAPYRLAHDEGGLLASLLARQPLSSDVEPQRARDVLYLAMTELVLKVADAEPCLFVLEDAQWADQESLAWFDHVLGRAARRPLFVLVLARPTLWKDQPDRFAGRDHVRLELRPVSRRATMEIARAVMGAGASDEQLAEVARQAAGSPLFAEELARVMAAGKSAAAVPTIEAAIQVSLDALAPELRDALMRLSVFGLAAWENGLRAVEVPRAGQVLDRLARADFVVEQDRSRFPDTREFLFKHALVRDVCYASMSEALRGELHARAASWFAEVGEDAATIAEHYDLGGEHERAADYWAMAASRALLAHALDDAVRMADRALTFAADRTTAFARAMLLDEAYSRLDERSAERSEAIEAMALHAYDEASEVRSLGARARYDHARSAGCDVAERLQEAASRSAELGLVDEEARCIATLAARHAFAGELPRAEVAAARLLQLAERPGVESAAVDAWQTLAVVQQTRGELVAALEARRNAAGAARAAGLKQREAMLTVNLGFALTTIGARDESRRAIEEGIRMAGEIGSPGTVRLGRMLLLGWAAHFGADPSLDEALAEPRASADEAATGMWLVRDRVTLGTLFYRGCELLRDSTGAGLRRACALLQISADAYRATENRDVLPVALGYWAEACRRLGDVEQAERLGSEAAELVEAGAPSLLNEAIIYLALHSARVQLGDLAGARSAVERAMPALLRRVGGLGGTSYVRDFLLGLDHNAQLLEVADRHGCLPAELEPLLEG